MTLNHELLPTIHRLHEAIRDRVLAACEAGRVEDLAAVASDDEGDTIFAIDRVSEAELLDCLERELPPEEPVLLIAEGLSGGRVMCPRNAAEQDARWRIIVDPIDGTRCLMYQKRSGWILTGVARNRGPETNLADIELAVQTEIPILKQHLSDQLWAVRGQGAEARRSNRLTGESQPWIPAPSRARTIRQGYAMVTRFFPGARDVLAAIDDRVAERVLGPAPPDKALTFEDQYASTGGQLYGLLSGQDRFVADLRPLLKGVQAQRRQPLGLCCHPYDICAKLIAEELGVIVTDVHGRPLHDLLNVADNVAWIGYANAHIRREVEPELQAAMRDCGLLIPDHP